MSGLEQVNIDDLELVTRAQEKSAEAFETLVLRYQDRVFNTAFRFTGDRSLAEDITQEVFLKVFGSLKKFLKKSSFSTWLYRITVNACTSHWRRQGAQKRGKEVPLPGGSEESGKAAFDPPSDVERPEEAMLRDERNRIVQEAILGLEEEFRVVVVLRDIEGFSYEDIAEIIERPVGTVRSRLHRARNELKEKLSRLL